MVPAKDVQLVHTVLKKNYVTLMFVMSFDNP